MGFLENILSGGVKTVLTPLVAVKDTVKIVVDPMGEDDEKEPFEDTVEMASSAAEDVAEGLEDLMDGDIL